MAEDELRNEIMEYQNLQQQIQLISMQKQQMQMQLSEIDKAIEELGKTGEKQQVYRLVGGVFIPKEPHALKKELAEEKEAIELRKSGILKQEGKITERFMALRKKLEAAQKASGAE